MRLCTYLLCAILAVTSAEASGVPMTLEINGGGHGGTSASTGFLPATTTTVGLTQLLYQNNDLTNGTWTTSQSGVAAPTITNVSGFTLPDGTTGTVSSVQLPQVSGASHYSVVTQSITATINANPIRFGYWTQMASTSCGTPYLTISLSTTFERAPIIADGTWHLTTVDVPPNTFANNSSPEPQIGINLFDSGQSAQTCQAPVLYLTGGFIVHNPQGSSFITSNTQYPYFKAGGTLANTTNSYISGALTVSLPAHTRFRNFAGLTPQPANYITQNQNEIAQNGGISNPYFSQDFQFGGFYWGFSNCTSSLDHTAWMSMCLYKTTDWVHLTEDTTNSPYLILSGTVFAQPSISSSSGWTASGTGTATWTGGVCAVSPVVAITSTGGGPLTAVTPSPNNGVGTGACPNSGAGDKWPTTGQTTWSYTGLTGGTAAFTFASVRGTAASVLNYWQLHTMFLPGGCYANGAAHAFCVLTSGINTSSNTVAIYEAYTDTSPDNAYTWVGCVSPGPCATPTQILAPESTGGGFNPSGNNNPSLVAIKNVGGTAPSGGGLNYITVSSGGGSNQGVYTAVWTTPADTTLTTAGNVLTYKGIGITPVVSGADYDYANGSTEKADPYIFLNRCGFYEAFTTSYNNTTTSAPFANKIQLISYAITDSLDHAWYPYQVGPIIPDSSPMYGGTPYIGDSTVNEIGGQFIWWGNFDDGEFTSTAVMASMAEGTGCP